ncbi:MAG: hypothetical protein OXF62_08360 [Caldilineaceae bacterium]|nr:hypothetical protein [Caldilineaceae bacterium]
MHYSVALVQRMGGAPFPCHIDEYMRTAIYRIPKYKVEGRHLVPTVVKKTADFKATVLTNPIDFLRSDGFSSQFSIDAGFEGSLKTNCKEEEDKGQKTVFVAIQFRQNLGLFPAVDGQSVVFEDDGKELILIYDCSDAPGPNPDQKTETVHVTLAAVRAGLDVTDPLEKVFDRECFRTDGGRCAYRGHIGGSAHVTLVSPITLEDLTKKLQASKILVAKIEKNIELDRINSLKPEVNDFGTRLRELVEALQLDPSKDNAYLRLWYLRLWDRVDEFRKLFPRRQRPPEFRNNSLAQLTKHRHAVAHRRVDSLDGEMSKALQEKVFAYFRQHL